MNAAAIFLRAPDIALRTEVGGPQIGADYLCHHGLDVSKRPLTARITAGGNQKLHWRDIPQKRRSDIHDALRTMEQRRVLRLPVLQNGKIVGLMSLNDAALKARSNEAADLTAEDVEQTLKAICSHPTFALGFPFKAFGQSIAAA